MTLGRTPSGHPGLASFWQAILDLIFPPRCASCGRAGALLCPSCLETTPRVLPPYCQRCGKPLEPGPERQAAHFNPLCTFCRHLPPALDGIRSPYVFAGAMRQAIHSFKYGGLSSLAPVLGYLLAQYLRANPLPVDVIVPVPLHPQRRRERGYDQAELLAAQLARETGLPLGKGWLLRQRPTLPQVKAAGAADRRRNMIDAFAPGPRLQPGQAVLLVDDVCTTGATLEACAQALRRGGAPTSVWGLTLAREA